MKKLKQELEENIFHRLIKVAYVGTLFLSMSFVILIGWTLKPYSSVDEDKSRVVCENGNTYKLSSFEAYWSSYQTSLDAYDDERVKKVCFDRSIGRNAGYTEAQINNIVETSQINKNYKIDLAESTTGSWTNVLLFWIVGLVLSYGSLNLIKETLHYVLFGQKFSWGWLKQIINLLNN
jgi:hypothetical protein